jgi:hypothetical protein
MAPTYPVSTLRLSGALCLAALQACGGSTPDIPASRTDTGTSTSGADGAVGTSTGTGVGGSGAASGSTDTTAVVGAATTGGINLTTTTGAGGTTPIGLGQEDLCDGIDNDQNGIIDDVDVGKDGVCDCLRIATLGTPGPWGEGDVFDSWLDMRSNNGAADLADTVLTRELLNEYQVVVAQDLSVIERSYAPEEVTALSDWVSAGGGFMTLIGYADPDEVVNVNTLLAAFGLSYGDQQILQRGGGQTMPVTGWMAHPVTEGVSQIGVDNGYAVQGGSVIATEGGFDVLTAAQAGMGGVLMWGDEWITYNSEWTEHPEYQVELFWVNAIKWLTPATDCQVPVPETIK